MKFNTFKIVCGKCGEVVSPELLLKSFSFRFVDDGFFRIEPVPLDYTDSNERHICLMENTIGT